MDGRTLVDQIAMHVHTNVKLAKRQALVHFYYCISTNTDIQIHSTVSHLDAPMRSLLIRGRSQGAEIVHPENFSPLV
jgi:hypothetical protein